MGYDHKVAVTSDPNTLRGRLTNEVTVALNLNQTLQRMVPHPSAAGGGGLPGGKPSSKPPWNHRAAILVMDLHAMARNLESQLLMDMRLAAQTQRVPLRWESARGSSDENTKLALKHVVTLSYNVGDNLVLMAIDGLGGWVTRANVALGEHEPPKRLPREPGKREPRCPWCTYQTLRMRLSVGTVTCVNPGCSDSLGARPVGLFLVDPVSGETAISWRDGTVGLPEPTIEMRESA